jgi:hypothetical protein
MKRSVMLAQAAAIGLSVLVAQGGGASAAARLDPGGVSGLKLMSAQAGDTCIDEGVAPLANTGIQGSARVCVNDTRVRADMLTEHLTTGDVYTVWFVYFDDPATCAASPCVGADALGDDPAAVFSRMDGVVAQPSGAAQFAADLRDFRLSHGSVVWLLMFGHGQANQTDNRARARQLLTPQSPMLGAPAAGAAADGEIGSGVARAVFVIP